MKDFTNPNAAPSLLTRAKDRADIGFRKRWCRPYCVEAPVYQLLRLQ